MTEFYELVKSKRSVRSFTNDPLPDDAIHEILEAGQRAGSAKNMQPWHFVAVTQRDTLTRLSTCGAFAEHVAGAALGIVLVTENPFYRLTVPFDLGRAAQNMMLTAWSWGIGSEMATIYRADEAREILGVPSTHVIPWCISFGYPVTVTQSPPRKGGRKSPAEVIHFEQW